MAEKKYNYIRKTCTITQSDGTKKRLEVRAATEKEAIRKLAKLQAEYDLGIRSFNSNTSFYIWAQQWLEIYKKPVVAAAQLKDIEARINKYFIPLLGSISISEIKTGHIQECLNELEGKSNSFQKKCYNDINSIFKKAIANDMVLKNPAENAVLPRGKEQQERRALTAAEIEIYRRVSAKHPYGVMFDLSLDCGLRPQEVRALTWSNVDLKNGLITITGAVKSRTNTIAETKSKAGIRQVPIPNNLLARLKEMRQPSLGLVFADYQGKPISIDRYERAWHSFYRLMDIEAGAQTYRNQVIIHAIAQDITPYYLRHTYATSLAEKGVPMKTAQVLLGHSSITVTAKVYTHFTPAMLEEARQKING